MCHLLLLLSGHLPASANPLLGYLPGLGLGKSFGRSNHL
jgi:hypothetical protein